MKRFPLTLALFLYISMAFGQNNLIITTPVSETPGFRNVMVGLQLSTKPTIRSNVIIGYRAASLADSIEHNVIIGSAAGDGGRFRKVNSSVVIGNLAGQDNRGSNVVMIGQNAGRSNLSAGNIFIGSEAGTRFQGDNSVIIGRFATHNNKDAPILSRGATYIGHEVAQEDSLSSGGTYVGFKTGVNFRTGDSNTFIGSAAGSGGNEPNFGRGSFNTFIGNNAGGLIRRTSENTFVGYQAGFLMADGKANVIIGTKAGSNLSDPVEGLVLVGNNAQAKNGLRNAGAIGANARVDASNALILGNTAMRVGIGTTIPQNKLEIVADGENASGLRLSRLTTQSPTQGTSDKSLSVNAQGDVILVSNTSADLTALLNRLTALEAANTELQARVRSLEEKRCILCFPRKAKNPK